MGGNSTGSVSGMEQSVPPKPSLQEHQPETIKECLMECLGLHITGSINQFHKSQNAPVPYPRMLHSEQKCTHFFSEWSILGYGTSAFWDLWIRSIATKYLTADTFILYKEANKTMAISLGILQHWNTYWKPVLADPIAHPWGRDMGCLLWVQTPINVLPQLLQCHQRKTWSLWTYFMSYDIGFQEDLHNIWNTLKCLMSKFILRINSIRIFWAWSIWAEVTF